MKKIISLALTLCLLTLSLFACSPEQADPMPIERGFLPRADEIDKFEGVFIGNPSLYDGGMVMENVEMRLAYRFEKNVFEKGEAIKVELSFGGITGMERPSFVPDDAPINLYAIFNHDSEALTLKETTAKEIFEPEHQAKMLENRWYYGHSEEFEIPYESFTGSEGMVQFYLEHPANYGSYGESNKENTLYGGAGGMDCYYKFIGGKLVLSATPPK